jgi:hypothetical protein
MWLWGDQGMGACQELVLCLPRDYHIDRAQTRDSTSRRDLYLTSIHTHCTAAVNEAGGCTCGAGGTPGSVVAVLMSAFFSSGLRCAAATPSDNGPALERQ